MRSRNRKTRSGAALLVVLMVVMFITIVTLGFISKSDVELVCGENMVRRVETDYAAQAALACSRSYWMQFYAIYKDAHLNPGFEAGMYGQPVKVDINNHGYFDFVISNGVINVSDPNSFTYDVRCEGYRSDGGVKTAQTVLDTKLHFKPVYDGMGVYDKANSIAFFKSIRKN